MRARLIPLAAAAFVLGCADVPTAPLLQPAGPSQLDYPPPPWAEVFGLISEDGTGTLSISPLMSRSGASATTHAAGATGTYVAWLLVAPGENAAWLRFTGGTGVTFSNGARIMKANGKVTGSGTVTFAGGGTYQLSAVTAFEANANCATTPWNYQGPICASFSAGDGSFGSSGSVWTGVLSNDLDGSAGSEGCAPDADFVVTTGAELSSALAAAGAGSTVAIDGVIEVPGSVVILGDDIRLTCATPGSGLISAIGSSSGALLQVSADGVRVDNLFLSSVPSDGVGGALHTVFAFQSLSPVERFRLSLNQIRCGSNGTCAFLVGAPGAVVSGNSVQSLGTASGIHVQGNGPIQTDNTIVERNDIVAPTVSGSPLFGAVRVRDGRNLFVRHNSSSGAWLNGIALSELDGAFIQDNSIRDSQERGILASTNPLSPVSVRNSIIRENRIEGPQAIGISLNRACWNRIENNEIRVAAGTLRARFEATTGANVYVGSPARVLDEGNFDCDGNGYTDPNTIAGKTGVSSSQPSAARIAPSSLSGYRLPPQYDGVKPPPLQ